MKSVAKKKSKPDFDLVYKSTTYRTWYKDKEYFVNYEYDEMGGGDWTVTGINGEKVSETISNFLIEACVNK